MNYFDKETAVAAGAAGVAGAAGYHRRKGDNEIYVLVKMQLWQLEQLATRW